MRVHALKIFRNSLAMSVLSAVFSAIHLAPASLEITESYFFRPDRDRSLIERSMIVRLYDGTH